MVRDNVFPSLISAESMVWSLTQFDVAMFGRVDKELARMLESTTEAAIRGKLEKSLHKTT